MFNKHRSETITYLVLWGLLFMAPVLSLYIRTATDSTLTFDWSEVLMVWRQYGIYFAIFLVHNHLLAPQLVHRQRRTLYFSFIGVLVAGFVLYQCAEQPHNPKRHRPDFEQFDGHRPPGFDGERPPRKPDGMMKPDDDKMKPDDGMMKPDGRRPPVMFAQRDVVSTIMLILMLLANLGIKLYYKQRRDQQQMTELEKRSLEQQLEYLKYQINPHFLMNTLNNIHALVDINPEQAKDTILELSKLLRFMLYEGNKQTVPLGRELDFLDNYMQLMRLRYTDRVNIGLQKPSQLPDVEVPPLLFITFVENAFKHGVSYKQPSFIDIRIETINDHLTFTCRNSKLPKDEDKHDGLGLKNVKQRLNLIYGSNYTLDIDDQPSTYNILLVIPLNKTL